MSRTVLVVVCLGAAGFAVAQEDVRAKIAELERKLAAQPAGAFDWGLHNELRHHYGAVDRSRSMMHVDAILKRNHLDAYMKQVLGGADPDRAKAVRTLTAIAEEFPRLPNLSASCWIWAAELETDPSRAGADLKRALAVPGIDAGYRELIDDRALFATASRNKPWPTRIPAPKGMEGAPGPWSDPADPTVWPNTTSRANSDPWLAEHHDRIRQMRPRVLLINFSNEHSRDQLRQLTLQLIQAIAESSRYHGHNEPKAPVFLQYEVFRFVDLRDGDRQTGDSRKVPVKDPAAKSGFNMKYRGFFSTEFAAHYGVPDPREPGRFLRLDELLDGGYVHELWFFGSGRVPESPHVGAFEVVEEKPRYDESFRKVGQEWVQAGNGGDPDQPWAGRSVRLGFINASRGVGCFMESLSHGIEGMSHSGAIPYFTKYFREYAGFDLKERHGLPIDSLYATDDVPVQYTDPSTMIVVSQGKPHRVENYVAAGGNVHFTPNGRSDYDLDNEAPVLSTIEDWRIGSGPGGRDLSRPFTNGAFRRYATLAPDCMGQWLVYWRQNMPGWQNRSKDDAGRPMKNWWPFLFY